jgi:DNA excision repair protein ERCC-4
MALYGLVMKKILHPSDITIVIDSREQRPLDFKPYGISTTRGSLATGDYSVRGLEGVCAVERKSLPDLIMCVGRERERFDRECQRLLAYPCRAIVVEASWLELQAGSWRSHVKPEAALGSVLGWIAMGLPIIMAGNHQQAAKFAARILFIAARRRYRELVAFAQAANGALGQ